MKIIIKIYNSLAFAPLLLFVCIANLGMASHATALVPDEVLVIANRNSAKSIDTAEYYMNKRGIPRENLLVLWLTDKEVCSRIEYEKKVAVPVRRYLREKNSGIRCLVPMFGMPLKVSSPVMTSKDKGELKGLKREKRELHAQLLRAGGSDKSPVKKELERVRKKIDAFQRMHDKGASLDSELALVMKGEYSLSMWIPNPYFVGFRGKPHVVESGDVLMVSRLDGPTQEIVKRVINESIDAEKSGLKGSAYFDARWPDPGKKRLSGYALYDRSIHLAAAQVERSGLMPVIKENTARLFQPGECPGAALYCGWYKLAQYVDAFTWQKGSVGYHIASAECKTLKKRNSRVWCKVMLEKGVAATVGPVGEPYVQAFPVPEIFFGLLAKGELSLAECYMLSTPYLSWKMVLIGDPLYRPFKNRRTPGRG